MAVPIETRQSKIDMDALLRRLRWTVLRPLASRLGGDDQSLFRGEGMEFDELREYQLGDDVRSIDWNVTAREDKAFVRQAYVQRALDVWMVLDLSASVDWGTAQCLKRDRALEFIAVVGQIFERGHHHMGALFFADRPLNFIQPSAGRDHLFRLLEAVQNAPRQQAAGKTNLKSALSQLDLVLKNRCVVLILSDFLVEEGWQPILERLGRRHEVIAAHLRDPRENELPDVGMITLEDPETGQQLIVNTNDHHLRERFWQAAKRQSEQIRTTLTARGADYLELNTGEDLLPEVVRFLENRRRQAQRLNRGRAAQKVAIT